jgi:hypothetical protein
VEGGQWERGALDERLLQQVNAPLPPLSLSLTHTHTPNYHPCPPTPSTFLPPSAHNLSTTSQGNETDEWQAQATDLFNTQGGAIGENQDAIETLRRGMGEVQQVGTTEAGKMKELARRTSNLEAQLAAATARAAAAEAQLAAQRAPAVSVGDASASAANQTDHQRRALACLLSRLTVGAIPAQLNPFSPPPPPAAPKASAAAIDENSSVQDLISFSPFKA